MHDDYNFRYYIDIFNFKTVFTYNNVVSTYEQHYTKLRENGRSMSKCEMTKIF